MLQFNFKMFSQYKDILGKPKEGIHRYRFLNLAIFDFMASLILACIITLATKVPLVITTVGTLVLGFFLHLLFGVETQAVKYLCYSSS